MLLRNWIFAFAWYRNIFNEVEVSASQLPHPTTAHAHGAGLFGRSITSYNSGYDFTEDLRSGSQRFSLAKQSELRPGIDAASSPIQTTEFHASTPYDNNSRNSAEKHNVVEDLPSKNFSHGRNTVSQQQYHTSDGEQKSDPHTLPQQRTGKAWLFSSTREKLLGAVHFMKQTEELGRYPIYTAQPEWYDTGHQISPQSSTSSTSTPAASTLVESSRKSHLELTQKTPEALQPHLLSDEKHINIFEMPLEYPNLNTSNHMLNSSPSVHKNSTAAIAKSSVDRYPRSQIASTEAVMDGKLPFTAYPRYNVYVTEDGEKSELDWLNTMRNKEKVKLRAQPQTSASLAMQPLHMQGSTLAHLTESGVQVYPLGARMYEHMIPGAQVFLASSVYAEEYLDLFAALYCLFRKWPCNDMKEFAQHTRDRQKTVNSTEPLQNKILLNGIDKVGIA